MFIHSIHGCHVSCHVKDRTYHVLILGTFGLALGWRSFFVVIFSISVCVSQSPSPFVDGLIGVGLALKYTGRLAVAGPCQEDSLALCRRHVSLSVVCRRELVSFGFFMPAERIRRHPWMVWSLYMPSMLKEGERLVHIPE